MFLINQSKIDYQSLLVEKNILSFIGLNKGLHDGDIAAVIIGFTRQLAFTISINQFISTYTRGLSSSHFTMGIRIQLQMTEIN